MKTKKWMKVMAYTLAAAMTLGCMAGCGGQTASAEGMAYTPGGVLTLSVNPEIAVFYDGNGNVERLEARNEDGKKILEGYNDYQGREARQVVSELVDLIGGAGYFAEQVENEDGTEGRRITIEVEPGSILPEGTFLENVVDEAKQAVMNANWNGTVYTVDYDAGDFLYGTPAPETSAVPKATDAPKQNTVAFRDDDVDVFYDSTGRVTRVVSMDDGRVDRVYQGFDGGEIRESLLKLIDAVEKAGYAVEEVENEGNHVEVELISKQALPAGVSAAELNDYARSRVQKAVWNGTQLWVHSDAEDYLGFDLDDPDDPEIEVDDADDADDMDDDQDDWDDVDFDDDDIDDDDPDDDDDDSDDWDDDDDMDDSDEDDD